LDTTSDFLLGLSQDSDVDSELQPALTG
jgi:hypothetical protein